MSTTLAVCCSRNAGLKAPLARARRAVEAFAARRLAIEPLEVKTPPSAFLFGAAFEGGVGVRLGDPPIRRGVLNAE